MTSKRANAVNRAIAEACGYYIYHYDKDHPAQCYYMLSIPNDCHWAGWDQLRFRNEWGQWKAGERKTEKEAWNDVPDYYNSLDEAIAAAGELLPGRWQLIHFNSGFRFDWSDNTDKWYDIHPKSNAPADIASAICEAIVTARQMVVESEVSE